MSESQLESEREKDNERVREIARATTHWVPPTS